MIISLRKWIRKMIFLIVLVVFTFIISILFEKISLWVEQDPNYQQPSGQAVKVLADSSVDNKSMLDRLRFFYWYGE